MDKSRVAGIDITVEKASEENGYVELTPEAEQNSWAMIGKALGLFLMSVALFMLCLSPAAGRNLTKQGKSVSVTLYSQMQYVMMATLISVVLLCLPFYQHLETFRDPV